MRAGPREQRIAATLAYDDRMAGGEAHCVWIIRCRPGELQGDNMRGRHGEDFALHQPLALSSEGTSFCPRELGLIFRARRKRWRSLLRTRSISAVEPFSSFTYPPALVRWPPPSPRDFMIRRMRSPAECLGLFVRRLTTIRSSEMAVVSDHCTLSNRNRKSARIAGFSSESMAPKYATIACSK